MADLPQLKDFEMRIARDGTWYHQGRPIRRLPLVKLFSTVLRRDEEGRFWLQTPVERGRIEVEDAPFTAVELSVTGQGESQVLAFRTNLDEWVEADSDHPIRLAQDPDSGEPRPYIEVRNKLEALILRSVFYELADLAGPGPKHPKQMGVWSHGAFFPFGPGE